MTRSVDYHQDGKPSLNTGNQVKCVHGGDGECSNNACGTDPLWDFSSQTNSIFLSDEKSDAFITIKKIKFSKMVMRS